MNNNTKILVTGGAGYIGSHCILKLLELGYNNIITIDNFSNSTKDSLQKIEEYTKKEIHNENLDLKDSKGVKEFFSSHTDITTIIHFAALKDPFESINNAQAYYENNVGGLINLLKYSSSIQLSNFIFSSTCALYGEPNKIPVDENHPINPQNPYANSKWICENILKDVAKERNFKAVSLRYFNPIGSNSKAGLKEYYSNRSKNIVPQIIRVIKGEVNALPVYGNDLPTKDGSGVRDFIHVEDLVEAHLRAMEFLNQEHSSLNYDVYNVGRGMGISVLKLINEFESQLDIQIPMNIVRKRKNEVAEIYADSSKINAKLNWRANKNLAQMVEDTLMANDIIY
ncbi:UDP-glucose 4-epimerase GalE [Marivirga harenae]|uniref:UDP-glucose 4-epimerase GalE n=1 Tax=Marivirga harenae TaxID=2010992 RepID=UPI0026DFDB87|nr:UDP-glucose 4-epimerase GalE [Marivirga harenae]WKV13433.1 UDP-glucose 4-epimerase GalE [Marivirga harenae]